MLLQRSCRIRANSPNCQSGQWKAAAMTVDLFALVSAFPFLMKGLWFTLQITFVGVAGGIVFGSLLAIARLSQNRLSTPSATACIQTRVRSFADPDDLLVFFPQCPGRSSWIASNGSPVAVERRQTIFDLQSVQGNLFRQESCAPASSISSGQWRYPKPIGLSDSRLHFTFCFPRRIHRVCQSC